MTKAAKRSKRKRRLLVVLIVLLPLKPVITTHSGERPPEEERRKELHAATPSAHARWLASGSEKDAQAFVLESVHNGQMARVVPGFADHYRRILGGDKTALENTTLNWNDAAEWLDERLNQGF